MWPDVDFREIRVFLALAEELHFGHAAERLTLTPSRVSQSLRSLESRVGGRLFDRTSRRVSLTPLGEEFLRRVAPAYEQMKRALAATREAAKWVAGDLRLGTYTPVNGGRHLQEIVRTFELRHPACKVVTIDTWSRYQFDWLRRGEVDVMAMRLPVSEPDITVGPRLSREERVVILNSAHPLARRRSVSYEDLADYAMPYYPTIPGEIVPIRDLPPSETALVWLTSDRSLKVAAFARAAADVLEAHQAAAATGPSGGYRSAT